jgi:hypothetical protein
MLTSSFLYRYTQSKYRDGEAIKPGENFFFQKNPNDARREIGKNVYASTEERTESLFKGFEIGGLTTRGVFEKFDF